MLDDNASCGYCRSHQCEVARWWAVPAMTDLAAVATFFTTR